MLQKLHGDISDDMLVMLMQNAGLLKPVVEVFTTILKLPHQHRNLLFHNTETILI